MKLTKYDIMTLEHIFTLIRNDLDRTDNSIVNYGKQILVDLKKEVVKNE